MEMKWLENQWLLQEKNLELHQDAFPITIFVKVFQTGVSEIEHKNLTDGHAYIFQHKTKTMNFFPWSHY